jgi:hypothetical protein
MAESSSKTATPAFDATEKVLYGDLLGVILFATLLPFVTYEVIGTLMGDGGDEATSLIDESTRSDDDGNNRVPQYRLVLQLLVGYTTTLCCGMANYLSYHRRDETTATTTAAQESVHDPIKSQTNTSSYKLARISQQWSYAAFCMLNVSMAILALNNWPHVDEQTLPGHFVWNLIVATANVPHSLRTKYIMGGITLLIGLVIVAIYPQVYPLMTFAPMLTAITGTNVALHLAVLYCCW